MISEVAQDREPWGNFNMRVEFRPTDKIYAEGDATYNPYTEDFVAYNALLRLSDERGDAIMMDYRYLENAVNWLSSELRLAINSEWALSYINLTDFDDDSRNFENSPAAQLQRPVLGRPRPVHRHPPRPGLLPHLLPQGPRRGPGPRRRRKLKRMRGELF